MSNGTSARGISWVRRALVPSVPCLLLLALAARTLLPEAQLTGDSDIALHVLHGELVLDSGALLAEEPTSFAAIGTEYIAHEWLSQILFALLHRALGFFGPMLLLVAVMGGLQWATYHRARRLGAGPWPALGAAATVVLLLQVHAMPRPHLFTWCFAFALAGLLEARRRREVSTWPFFALCIAIVFLWCNLHGGFLFAGPLVGAYGLGQLWEVAQRSGAERRSALRELAVLAALGAALLATSLLNPWGWSTHVHFLAWLANPFLQGLTAETQSPPLFELGLSTLFYVFAATTVSLLLAGDRRAPAHHVVLVVGTLALAITAVRHVPLFALMAAPIAAARLQGLLVSWRPRGGTRGRIANDLARSDARLQGLEARTGGAGLALAVFLTLAIASAALGVPRAHWDERAVPVAAADWIETHPEELRGRMFNHFDWGGYLAWRLYPRHRVFMNSWHDHLGESTVREYLRIYRAQPGAREALQQRGVGWTCLPPQAPLATALDRDSDWHRVYADRTAVVHARR